MRPAWRDEDDEQLQINPEKSTITKKLGSEVMSGTEYTNKLRSFYNQLHYANWAYKDEQPSNHSLAKLLSTAKPLFTTKQSYLPSTTIDITQQENPNKDHQANACITALDFHQDQLLIGSRDKYLRIFQQQSDEFTLHSSIFLKNSPVQSAGFLQSSIFASGRRPYYFHFDIPSTTLTKVPVFPSASKTLIQNMLLDPENQRLAFLSTQGHALLYSPRSNKLIHQFQMNEPGKAGCFLDDSTLITGGEEGDIYFWDLRMNQCRQRIHDEGALHITALAGTQRFVAVGCSSGNVNLYETGDFERPIGCIPNLTTAVEGVRFNRSGEILAIWSRWQRDGVKLVHVQSKSVFANWPDFKAHLKYPFVAGFSEDSRYLAVGNDEGNVLMYRLNYYT